jgi:hypothetical protein
VRSEHPASDQQQFMLSQLAFWLVAATDGSFLPQTRINYSAVDANDLGLKHPAMTRMSGQQFAFR